jgi:hypothetical protein
MRYFGVELQRQNFTDLATKTKPCSDWEQLDGQSGLAELKVSDSKTTKTVEQCYWDFFHAKLGCRLPWCKLTSGQSYKTCYGQK